MSTGRQKTIWDKIWEHQSQISSQEILNSRFTQEAYHCLKNFINSKSDNLVLEAGCGTGRLCCLIGKDFPEFHIIGIDVSPNSLMIANRLKEYLQISNVSFVTGNLFQMPYPNDRFDTVFNEGVIEHFSLDNECSYIDALREMIRVTKPGGKLVVAVPNWFNFPHTVYKWVLNKAGKIYMYEYEKSFKHLELVNLYSGFNLKDIELLAFYPAHGFYRLSGSGIYKIFPPLGKLTDAFQLFIDRCFNKQFTKMFGFEIVIKGVKQ